MAIDIPLFGCYAALAVVTFSTVQSQSLVAKGSFLAGEYMPVWAALRSKHGFIEYHRFHGAVKKALDYWKSGKYISRPGRSVDENAFFTEEFNDGSFMEENNSSYHHTTKRESDSGTRFPSVLAVMEYETEWPFYYDDEQQLITDRVLYCLGFWNNIDRQLKIRNSNWKIRLAGIVIAEAPNATFMSNGYTAKGFYVKNPSASISKYWDEKRAKPLFQADAWNIVATMTLSVEAKLTAIRHSTAKESPCNFLYEGTFGSIFFNDDLLFSGVQTAIAQIANVMKWKSTVTDNCKLMFRENPAKLDSCHLDWIKSDIAFKEHGSTVDWCTRQRTSSHPSGNKLETILPGKVIPAGHLCQARGHGKVCWGDKNITSCTALVCKHEGQCSDIGPPVDGTTCDTEKMCLDGKCVSKTTPI